MMFLVVAAAAGWLLSLRPLSERFRRIRLPLRAMYRQDAWLLPLRMTVVTAPIFGIGAAIVAVATLPNREVGAWLAWPGFAVVVLGIVLSYFTPRALYPRWLAAELEAGSLAPARPDLIDWAFFALVVPVSIIGLAAYPVLLVAS